MSKKIKKALLTVDEARMTMNISRATIYRLFSEGSLRYVQIGSKRLVPIAEIERFIDEGMNSPKTEERGQ